MGAGRHIIDILSLPCVQSANPWMTVAIGDHPFHPRLLPTDGSSQLVSKEPSLHCILFFMLLDVIRLDVHCILSHGIESCRNTLSSWCLVGVK